MIPPALFTLLISGLATVLCFNTSEEIVKVGTAGLAVLCLLVSMVQAPWTVLLFLVVPLVGLKAS